MICQCIENTVEALGGLALDPCILGAIGTAGVDDLSSFGPKVQHFRYHLGLVLQINVLGDAYISARVVDGQNVSVDLGAGFAAEILESYVLTGRVVTRKPYRFEAVAKVSLLDLGMIYGELLNPEYDARVWYRTGTRMIRFRADDTRSMLHDWEHLLTKNHLIPADAAVKAALVAVEVGQAVQIRGCLVSATGDGLRPWTLSRVRRDGFPAGCDIILLRSVEALSQENAVRHARVAH